MYQSVYSGNFEKIDLVRTIRNPCDLKGIKPVAICRSALGKLGLPALPFYRVPKGSRTTIIHFPHGGGRDVKILNDCMEKKIGGVLYRVHSVYSGKGDFQALSESLLESRVMKHYG